MLEGGVRGLVEDDGSGPAARGLSAEDLAGLADLELREAEDVLGRAQGRTFAS